MAASAPANALALYNQYLTSSNPTLSYDANTLEEGLNDLDATQAALTAAEANYAAAKAGQNPPDVSGHPQGEGYWGNLVGDLQGRQRQQWLHVRGLEATFYSDLSATSDDTNATMASVIYQSYLNDAFYTMEGEMPATYTGGHITPASVNAASTPLTAASSAAYNALVAYTTPSALPANAANELTDPAAATTINQADYTQITQGFMRLYQNDPAAYYQALAQVSDPNLAGAINFAVNDMAVNHPEQLQANGATQGTEQGALGNYCGAMHKTPATYYAWAPPTSAATYTGSTDIDTLVSHWNNAGNVESMLKDPTATTDGKFDEHNFWDTAQFMLHMYHDHRDKYYQLLHQIKDPSLRDTLNRAVLVEYAKNPNSYGFHHGNTGTGAQDSDFKGMWGDRNKSGFQAGTGASGAGVALSPNSSTNGK